MQGYIHVYTCSAIAAAICHDSGIHQLGPGPGGGTALGRRGTVLKPQGSRDVRRYSRAYRPIQMMWLPTRKPHQKSVKFVTEIPSLSVIRGGDGAKLSSLGEQSPNVAALTLNHSYFQQPVPELFTKLERYPQGKRHLILDTCTLL